VVTPGRSRQIPSIKTPRPSGRTGKWSADISYIRTVEGWLYLAVVIDLFSRQVVALRGLHANPFRVTAGHQAID